MAIVFEFEAGGNFQFVPAFAKRYNKKVVNNRVILPATMGEGYIQEVSLGNSAYMDRHHYTLKQELIFRRRESAAPEMLVIKFYGRRGGKSQLAEFGTGNFFTEVRIPPKEEINFIVIAVTRQSLLQVLQPGQEGVAVETMIRNNPSFVLHEEMTGEMERTLQQLGQINETTKLPALLYQIKVQELLYVLFSRLFSRRAGVSVAINQDDAEKIYQVRMAMLANLAMPPKLTELAKQIGMSPTKMKQLFRQIYGDSIYNYYQAARMNEAANLLRNFPVAQAGYNVGFSNLSHFTRVFEKHHQMKPKRYKDTLGKRSLEG